MDCLSALLIVDVFLLIAKQTSVSYRILISTEMFDRKMAVNFYAVSCHVSYRVIMSWKKIIQTTDQSSSLLSQF